MYIFFFLTQVLFQSPIEKLLDDGYALYENGRFEEAVKTFDKAQSLDPKEAEVYFLRGLCQHELGNIKKSIVDFEKAIELVPEYTEAHQQMGYVYLVSQAPQKAIKSFDRALELDSSLAEVYVNRGTAKCMAGDKNGAMEDWKIAKDMGIDYSEFMTCD